MQRWTLGGLQRIAEKLLDVVNKYDLLIDTLDRLAITAIVNAIDATSGGKVKALIIAHVIRPPAALPALPTA